MLMIDAAIQKVREYRKAAGLSLAAYARAAGLRDTVLRKIDDPSWNPTRKTLERLEKIAGGGAFPDQAA